MPAAIRVRLLQALFGLSYGVLTLAALARSPSFVTVVVAAAMMLLSYLSGRTVPDALVPPSGVFGVSAIALALFLAGVVAMIVAGERVASTVAIVMAYCAGNCIRAAGLGPAR